MASSSSSSSYKYPKAKHPIPRPLQLPDLASAGGSSPKSAGISPSGFGVGSSTSAGVPIGNHHDLSSSPISTTLDGLTSPPPSSYPYTRNGHAHSASVTSSSRPQSRTSFRNSGVLSATAGYANGTSSSPGNSTPIRSPTSSKRQSTISYFSPDQEASRDRDWKRLSAASGSGGGLGLVVGGAGSRRSTRGTRDSLGSGSALGLVDDAGVQKERPKLTLVEQHADLLHSIAAKEAQCLELRTQLSTHEEELAQLKRKWERIVNRGPDRENHMANSNTAALLSQSSPLSPLTSSLTAGTSMITFGLGMEGLKGGVQEMGRLLGVGLTSAAGASASVNGSSGPPSRQDSLAPSPSLRPASISRGPSPSPLAAASGSRLERGASQRHRAKESSNSSSSTTQSSRTTATSVGSSTLGSAKARHRLSQCSSATSYDGRDDDDDDDDDDDLRSNEKHTPQTKNTVAGKKDSLHNSPQELIITDTGATPTMSPNPAFLEQRERRRRRRDKEEEEEQERGKVGGGGTPASADGDPWDVWGNGSDAPSPSVSPAATSTSMHAKQLRAPGPAADNMSKGIVGGIGQVGQGWMDTVGKKLGEFQKSSTVSALSKSQKRASLIFSDMGQTIASALTDPGIPSTRPLTQSPLSPPLASAPSHGQGKAHNLTLARALSANLSSASSHTPSSGASLSTPLPSSSRVSPSLLDDDDDDVFERMISAEPVLTPDNKLPSGTTSALKPSASSAKLERRRSVKASASKGNGEETDGLEWNW